MLILKKEFQSVSAILVLLFSAQVEAEVTGIVDDLYITETDSQSLSTPLKSKLETELSSISLSSYGFSTNLDQDNYTASAEFWSKSEWGFSAKVEETSKKEESMFEKTELARINVNKKLLTSEESDSYLALGMGWQGFDVNKKTESEGLNFSLLGKLALKNNILIYGNGGLYQAFEEGTDSDQNKAYTLEAGVKYKVDSNLSVSAGLKVVDVDDLQLNKKEQSSFLIGTQLKF